jgi:hypothetical protein
MQDTVVICCSDLSWQASCDSVAELKQNMSEKRMFSATVKPRQWFAC